MTFVVTDENARVPRIGDVYIGTVTGRNRYTVTRIIEGTHSKRFVRPTAVLRVTEIANPRRRIPTEYADFRALSQDGYKLIETSHHVEITHHPDCRDGDSVPGSVPRGSPNACLSPTENASIGAGVRL